jgi:large subunit ribosomal protein L10
MNKKEKQIVINNVLHSLDKCLGVFVVDFKGINAFKVVELKKNLFKANGEVVVVKNSLLSFAAQKNDNFRKIESSFNQQIALVYAYGDIFKTALVLSDFLQDAVNIKFKAGLINNTELNSRDFEKISKIKSQSELHSRLCGMLKNPIINLISVLMQISKK